MKDEREAQVIAAAAAVFLRYGYKRTTMGDLAEAAGLSRPALYLRFCNKERIFEGVCRTFAAGILEEIRTGAAALETPQEKLRLAFELWVVRPFVLMTGAPDARDLADCGLEFAKEAVEEGYAAFEEELRLILETVRPRNDNPGTRPREIARILASSARGFKAAARDLEQLREMIDGLLKVVLAAMA